jgi:hypothetical protein
MELEEHGSIPFLDVSIINRKQDGYLDHEVYSKKTHMENYIHIKSHHHPTKNIGVLNTLAIRAIKISNEEILEQEKDHLTEVFKSM